MGTMKGQSSLWNQEPNLVMGIEMEYEHATVAVARLEVEDER